MINPYNQNKPYTWEYVESEAYLEEIGYDPFLEDLAEAYEEEYYEIALWLYYKGLVEQLRPLPIIREQLGE